MTDSRPSHSLLSRGLRLLRRPVVVACALAVFAGGALFASRGLASGSTAEIIQVRFGGDAANTRVVVELDRATRGQMIDAAAGDPNLRLALAGVQVREASEGRGAGLVRRYAVDRARGAAQIRL
ncbi:MAG TPA: hypothetical protein VGB49_07395, partial [Caulobacteraceae bacterium]